MILPSLTRPLSRLGRQSDRVNPFPARPPPIFMHILRSLVAAVLLAAAFVSVPGAAAAAPADPWGFAYLDNPAPPPGAVMDPTRQWGSWKASFPADAATVDHTGPGTYRVRFPHLAAKAGVAHVTAVIGAGPAWCQLGKWYPQGSDEIVEVQCYRHGGVPDDTRFGVTFTERSAPLPSGGFAYVYANVAGGIVAEYNSAGAPNATAYGGPGFYRVVLPGVGAAAGFGGNIQVTAAEPGAERRCKVADYAWGGPDVVVYVSCVDGITSAPADSTFTVTYHRERPVFAEAGPPKRFGHLLIDTAAPPPGTDFNSVGAANVVTPSGLGQNMVTFTALGVRETVAVTTAVGGKPDYCAFQDVWRNIVGDGVIRNVICFDANGNRAKNAAFVTFSSRV